MTGYEPIPRWALGLVDEWARRAGEAEAEARLQRVKSEEEARRLRGALEAIAGELPLANFAGYVNRVRNMAEKALSDQGDDDG